jgi:hypothetical protein
LKAQTYREDNIKMDFKQVVEDGVEWFYQEQDNDKLGAFVNTGEKTLVFHKM